MVMSSLKAMLGILAAGLMLAGCMQNTDVVADTFGFHMSGLPAWLVWAFIHLMFSAAVAEPTARREAMAVVVPDRAAQFAPDPRERLVANAPGAVENAR
jgi:hypothetical protein